MCVMIKNRKAKYNYELGDKYIAGIELKGYEVKSIRNGKANINDAFCIITNGEIFIKNMHVSPWMNNAFCEDPYRDRKLLLNKREILKLEKFVRSPGNTIVPTLLFFNETGKLKVTIYTAKGKHDYDKRETIKQRDLDREKII